MGFAYSKTRDAHQAEDLAQEILCELVDSLRKRDDVVNIDAFVYTISCYTWSNFLRRNKRHWGNFDVDSLHALKSEQNIEDEVAAAQLLEQLKTEIIYLNALHRRITVLFYYDNKTGAEIAKLLNIPHSTVRWHLTEIKKKLKVGIEMESTSFEPRKLVSGMDGDFKHGFAGLRGLGRNRLVDNICLACYGKALTIEEIARTLSVAAAYVEDHIRELVYMDLLQVVEKNKYTTTFFISTLRHEMIAAKYHFNNIKPYAEKIYAAFDKRYNAIKGIGFIGSDLDKDFLLWALMPIVLKRLYSKSKAYILTKWNTSIEAPKRKDGTRFWACATLCDEHYFNTQAEFTSEEVRFRELSTGYGVRTYHHHGYTMLQVEGRASIEVGERWLTSLDLADFHRIAEIIRNDLRLTETDKEIAASLIEKGYVRMEDDTLKMLIPFLFKDETDALFVVLDEIIEEVGETCFAGYIEAFAEIYDKELPQFITKGERAYHKGNIYTDYAVLYWLSKNGYLRYPTEEEARCLCTVVWNSH